jgi:CRP-like cAMP-binding protein
MSDIIEQIRGRGGLVKFTEEELQQLVEVCDTKTMHAGEVLWSLGDRRKAAYILVSGEIEQSIVTFNGRRKRQFSDPGSFLSLSALVDDWDYHSTAQTTQRSVLLMLTHKRFRDVFGEGRDVAYRLVDAIGEYLVNDMRDANDRLQDVFGNPGETLRMLQRRVREDRKF